MAERADMVISIFSPQEIRFYYLGSPYLGREVLPSLRPSGPTQHAVQYGAVGRRTTSLVPYKQFSPISFRGSPPFCLNNYTLVSLQFIECYSVLIKEGLSLFE